MEVIGCGRGHFYDPSEYSSCPQCAKEQLGGGKMDFEYDSIGATEPLQSSNFAAPGSVGSPEGIGVTQPVNQSGIGSAPEAPRNPDVLPTSYFAESSNVQDYPKTMPVTPQYPGDTFGAAPFLPVVGWLVCIEGSSKGKDYRIHSQYNYIGRAHHMDICIPTDEYISAERAAVLAYDDQEKYFSFGPGMGHNVVRVNGKMVMNAERLNAYDVLTIGKTKLLFVPLCGEKFDWGEE